MPPALTLETQRLLKEKLGHNLLTVALLNGQKGLKLRFYPDEGRFDNETDSLDRTMRNLKAGGGGSAMSSAMFEQPLLMTFYECKRRSFKGPNPLKYPNFLLDPDRAFQDAVSGLKYLRDTTYAGWGKEKQRTTVAGLLTKLAQLQRAPTRAALDRLIVQWVTFGLPHEMTRITLQAAADPALKDLILDQLPTCAKGYAEEILAPLVGDLIVQKYYRNGGGPRPQAPRDLDTKSYNEAVRRAAAGLQVQIQAQHTNESPGYFTFLLPNNVPTVARIYLHLTPDPRGQNALGALKVLLNYLTNSTLIREGIRRQISRFKICDLKHLYRGQDNAVIWAASYDSAKVVAGLLAAPLAPYTAAGLPSMVKPIAKGIGIAAEPEVRLGTLPLTKHSYGTHRSEIIGRGLITAALNNHGIVPSDPGACLNAVALKFQQYRMDFVKPYKPAQAHAHRPARAS